MTEYNVLFNNTWMYLTFDLDTGVMIEKEVHVTDCLEGPDGSDYVTVEGLQDWEVDISLRNFLKNARIVSPTEPTENGVWSEFAEEGLGAHPASW